MIVKPFRGLRPREDLASRIPSYPYDVVTSAEARQLAAGDPYSFLHVVKAEIDLDAEIDPYDDRVYARAAHNFSKMIENGWLVRDETPAYYVYRLTLDGKAQTGLVGAAAVRDYDEGRIKRHERTRPEKETDRVRLNDAISAHPGIVFLAYTSLPEINALVSGVVAREPQVRFTATDGIEHELWVVADPTVTSRIEALFRHIRVAYIADGHHRAAAAARVSAERIARSGGEVADDAPVRHFLAGFFPADQLRILEYNRVARDLNGLEPEELVSRIREAGFHVKAGYRAKRPATPETFGMYVGGTWYQLAPQAHLVPREDPVRRLDVQILTDRILQPILGIGDLRTDRRIEFVGGSRGVTELERLVDSGEHAVAFALYPTRLTDVTGVADAGLVLPPKSTWFEPKLRSGMVVQLLDGEAL
jgi:uncharacterized protein (DUF1015 family)